MYHQPVLLQACLDGLQIKKEGKYVDATFGGGGHSKEILKSLGEKGKLFAFDQDPDAAENVVDDKRLIFIPQNFRHLKNFLRMYGEEKVDGILADLGVSSHQFNSAERGFSIRFDADLDMRMDKSGKLNAAKILNEYSENDLRRMFREYGEIENAGKVARAIVVKRSEKKIETTQELKEMLKPLIFKKDKEHQYQARIFQALRIEVNDEMGALKEFLEQCLEVLKPGGRLVIMSYHSLEDRLVKNLMRGGDTGGEIEKDFFGNINRPFKLITKKPIEPDEQEILQNSRSRSARLRIAEKI
ncbi:MAG: 16S rRNA (cytosine(1402)-N(4))-methyltransferase RsmH [Bacteroidia bacterium]|nr:16S rRNA (cytosine(1402)-N(4))-methyltransferase RsmH [Bacteroidia bacterium]